MVSSFECGRNPGTEPNRIATLSGANNLPWYALQTQLKFGTVASVNLRDKGYEAWLPLYRSQRRWSDRNKTIELPLLPGYLFCRFDVNDRLMPILTTPGVIRIVGAGKNPVRIDEEEVEAIRAILRSGLAAQPWPFLGVGTRVYIEGGPLAGVEGIVTNTDKVCRLIVSVNLLQRSVAVEIDRRWARPIPDRISPRPVSVASRALPLAEAV